MLVYGTCNPEGYGDSSYEGLYLTDTDIREMTPRMSGIPVKIEHRGVDVGKVVTAWIHEGRMDVLMEIDDTHIEGAMGKEFVRRGICPELSLGYNVTMSRSPAGFLYVDSKPATPTMYKTKILRRSPAGFLKASNKRVVELSLVRQGARKGCKIHMFSQPQLLQSQQKQQQSINSHSSSLMHVNHMAQPPQKKHKILL